jgi:hypothetical protein
MTIDNFMLIVAGVLIGVVMIQNWAYKPKARIIWHFKRDKKDNWKKL